MLTPRVTHVVVNIVIHAVTTIGMANASVSIIRPTACLKGRSTSRGQTVVIGRENRLITKPL